MSEQNDDVENVDALYDRIMGTGDGADGPSDNSVQDQQATAPAPTPNPVDEYEFIHNGKQIKSNRENVLKWASQGYDYSQKMAEFSRRQNETNQRYSQAEELSKTYGPVDEWVRANPDKWDALQEAIEGNKSSGDVNPEIMREIQSLKEFKAQLETQQNQKKIAEEDASLDAEIKSIREKYADLDWNSVNENGHPSLEARVIEHATKNGINSFKAAFNDLLHDDLMKAAESRGRESLTKERKVKETNGLLGTTPAPTKGLTKPNNIKSKSYDDLGREGMDELGITY